MLTPIEKPRDAKIETGGQRPANAETGVKRLADTGGQRSESQKGPKSKSGGLRPAELGPELEDK